MRLQQIKEATVFLSLNFTIFNKNYKIKVFDALQKGLSLLGEHTKSKKYSSKVKFKLYNYIYSYSFRFSF